jgi:hypothetical protein
MWCLFMKIAMMGEVIQAQFIGASFWLSVFLIFKRHNDP